MSLRMTQVGSVYQLSFMPRFFPVNCYFVKEVDGLTLVDAALGFSAKPIMAAAEKIGQPIVRIILTHGHGDHVGALDELKNALPNAEVMISERDSKLLAGDVSMQPGESGKIKGDVPKKVTTRPDAFFKDGDMIGSLRAVASPGHTPGSMSFYHTDEGTLIAGDAFQIKGGMAVSGQLKPLFPFPAMATWDKAVAIESAKKLEALNPSYLAVGHGDLLKHPVPKMKQAIKNAEKKGVTHA